MGAMRRTHRHRNVIVAPTYATDLLRILAMQLARATGQPHLEICSSSRAPSITQARLAFVIGAHRLGASQPEIAKCIGRMAHSTVHGYIHQWNAGLVPAQRREYVERVLSLCPSIVARTRRHPQLGGNPAAQADLIRRVYGENGDIHAAV